MSYIICKDLSLGYDNKVIVEKLNFTVNKGDYLCVVGENGAGKSTLIKTLLHLQSPIKGIISMGDGLMSNEIGYLPQQRDFQKDFPATVWEVALSGNLSRCKHNPFYSKVEKIRTKNILNKMGILKLRKKCYRNLSGGQQQRVLLSRALCATEKVIILDEPITGLDPKAADDLYNISKELNKEGIAIIMVSHDITAINYATHVLHVKKSNSFFGTKKEYLQSEERKMFQRRAGNE